MSIFASIVCGVLRAEAQFLTEIQMESGRSYDAYWYVLFSNRYPATVVSSQVVLPAEADSAGICSPGDVTFRCGVSWDFCANNPGTYDVVVKLSWIDANDTVTQNHNFVYRFIVTDPADLSNWSECSSYTVPNTPPRINHPNPTPYSDLKIDGMEILGDGVELSNGSYKVTRDTDVTVKVKVSGNIHPKHALGGSVPLVLTVGEKSYSEWISVDALSAGLVQEGIFSFRISKPISEISAEFNANGIREKESDKANNFYKAIVSTVSLSSTLSIEEVRFAQVVYNPFESEAYYGQWFDVQITNSTYFYAVKGKSASFEVKIARNGTTAGANSTYQVQIKDGSRVIMDSGLRPVSEIPGDGTFVLPADKLFAAPYPSFVPNHEGSKYYSVEIVPNGPALKASLAKQIVVESYKTNAPTIGVMKASPLVRGETPPIAESKYKKILDQGKYLSSVMPVEDGGLSLKDQGDFKTKAFSAKNSVNYDIMELEFYRRMLGLNKMVGIVSGNYFAKKFPDPKQRGWVGATPEDSAWNNVMLVHEDFPGTIAHEFAHSNGVTYELYGSGQNVKTDGFDANPTGFFGERKSIISQPTYMGWDSQNFRWVDPYTYGIIFKEMKKPLAQTCFGDEYSKAHGCEGDKFRYCKVGGNEGSNKSKC